MNMIPTVIPASASTMVFGKRGDTPKSYECSQTGLNACMKDLASARSELGLLGDQLRAADAENAALREAAIEVLAQFKAVTLVWGDKFASGTCEQFTMAETALLKILAPSQSDEHPSP